MTAITGIHHVSLLVADTERALAFYCGVLGLSLAPRPPLAFPGAWLALGGQQIHLLELPNPDPVEGRPPHGGRDRHLALACSGLDGIRRRLDAEEVAYTLSKSGRKALFCRDYDGNAIELLETEART